MPLWQETRDASVYIYIDRYDIYIYMCLPLLPQKSETICPVFPPLKSVHPRRWGSCNQLPNLTISWIHIAAIPICAAVPNGSRFCWTSLGGIHFSSASMGFLWACPSWWHENSIKAHAVFERPIITKEKQTSSPNQPYQGSVGFPPSMNIVTSCFLQQSLLRMLSDLTKLAKPKKNRETRRAAFLESYQSTVWGCQPTSSGVSRIMKDLQKLQETGVIILPTQTSCTIKRDIL